jgi:hypothetical protein
MKTIIKSFFIFILFFLLSLPVVAFANHVALLVLQKQDTYQPIRIGLNESGEPIPTPVLRNGDANSNNLVDFEDVGYISNSWDHSASGSIDQYQDGKINAFDFAVIVTRLQK